MPSSSASTPFLYMCVLTIYRGNARHSARQTVKKAHCRGEHCSPVPVRPVRSFPKRALLRQVGGRTMFAPTFSIRQSRCFLTYWRAIRRDFMRCAHLTRKRTFSTSCAVFTVFFENIIRCANIRACVGKSKTRYVCCVPFYKKQYNTLG